MPHGCVAFFQTIYSLEFIMHARKFISHILSIAIFCNCSNLLWTLLSESMTKMCFMLPYIYGYIYIFYFGYIPPKIVENSWDAWTHACMHESWVTLGRFPWPQLVKISNATTKERGRENSYGIWKYERKREGKRMRDYAESKLMARSCMSVGQQLRCSLRVSKTPVISALKTFIRTYLYSFLRSNTKCAFEIEGASIKFFEEKFRYGGMLVRGERWLAMIQSALYKEKIRLFPLLFRDSFDPQTQPTILSHPLYLDSKYICIHRDCALERDRDVQFCAQREISRLSLSCSPVSCLAEPPW